MLMDFYVIRLLYMITAANAIITTIANMFANMPFIPLRKKARRIERKTIGIAIIIMFLRIHPRAWTRVLTIKPIAIIMPTTIVEPMLFEILTPTALSNISIPAPIMNQIIADSNKTARYTRHLGMTTSFVTTVLNSLHLLYN